MHTRLQPSDSAKHLDLASPARSSQARYLDRLVSDASIRQLAERYGLEAAHIARLYEDHFQRLSMDAQVTCYLNVLVEKHVLASLRNHAQQAGQGEPERWA